MTLHQIWVLYAGLVFCADALIMLGAVKALGPTYADRITVGWKIRGAVFVLAVIAFIRGITLVFPGRSVHVQFVPWMVPVMATGIFAVASLSTEWIISHRAPPPVMARLQASLAMLKSSRREEVQIDALAIGAGLKGHAAHVRLGGRRLRYLVITACALGLLLLVFAVLHAAAAELPR